MKDGQTVSGRVERKGETLCGVKWSEVPDTNNENLFSEEDVMKKIALVFSLIFFIVVIIGCAKGYEITKPAGEYNVTVTLDKNPPAAGENQMTIVVKDTSGNAVTDAAINVEYTMPAMPGMPAMHYTAEPMVRGTAYHTTLNLSMSGAWNIAVKITRHDKTEMVNFNVDAR